MRAYSCVGVQGLTSSAIGSASPRDTIDEDGDGLGGLRRNESLMSISGLLPRTGSELQISEMLDLFDQQGGGATPKQAPTPLPEGALPPSEPALLSAAPQLSAGGSPPGSQPKNLAALQNAAAPPPDQPPPPVADSVEPLRVPVG